MADVSKLEPKNNKRDRKVTEDKIVAAFERVLLRDGMQGLGVNAVAEEAAVNKVLIYRYFQGLPGLAKHWASHSTFWPTDTELIGNDPEAFAELPVIDRVSTVLCNYLDAIRSRPRTVQLLAGRLPDRERHNPRDRGRPGCLWQGVDRLRASGPGR
jgi:AcrR family transcriptional regulator